MAKDPAILWYWNDWIGGTAILTRHLKGCYIDLLAAQFNSGPLSLEQIKIVLGTDQASWTVLSKKFTKVVENGNELFFNERMEAEKEKRRKFSEKQSINGKKGGRKPTLNPTLNLNESLLDNENGNRKTRNQGDGFFPDKTMHDADLDETDLDLTIVYVESITLSKISAKETERMWKAFKIKHFTGVNEYEDWPHVVSHFRDWLKKQVQNNFLNQVQIKTEQPKIKLK